MLGLKPFFSYFGGKWRVSPKYPPPQYNTIIEPFAGSAGYSTRYYDRNVVLYEIDPKIFSVWDYIIRSSPQEILSLPDVVDHVDNIQVCQEAKYLIGFWMNKASTQPSKSPGSWMRQDIRPNSYWGRVIKERIAQQSEKIKHWQIYNRSYQDTNRYEDYQNAVATWFIDPPYHSSGKHYKFSEIDYKDLGEYCQSRYGQIIVCEQEGADWLPFEPFADIKATEGSRGKKRSKEVIWIN